MEVNPQFGLTCSVFVMVAADHVLPSRSVVLLAQMPIERRRIVQAGCAEVIAVNGNRVEAGNDPLRLRVGVVHLLSELQHGPVERKISPCRGVVGPDFRFPAASTLGLLGYRGNGYRATVSSGRARRVRREGCFIGITTG